MERIRYSIPGVTPANANMPVEGPELPSGLITVYREDLHHGRIAGVALGDRLLVTIGQDYPRYQVVSTKGTHRLMLNLSDLDVGLLRHRLEAVGERLDGDCLQSTIWPGVHAVFEDGFESRRDAEQFAERFFAVIDEEFKEWCKDVAKDD